MKLNTDNSTPLYLQLKEELTSNIQSGHLKPGQKIQTESQLSEQFSISRITVRRAIEELCRENYLIKKQGKGTFVQQHKIARKIKHLMSFTQACEADGLTVTNIIIKNEVIHLDEALAKEMNEQVGSPAIYIQRLRLADGIPIMCENNYFPYREYHFLLDESLHHSLYDLLNNQYQINVTTSKNSYIDITKASGELAKILQVANSEPLFYLYTKMFDSEDKLVHIGKQYIIASRYRFYLDDSTSVN